MKILGHTIHLPRLRERFKGFFDTGTIGRGRRKTFFLGEHSWRERCKHYDRVYERHGLIKEGILTIAGQITAAGIFLEPAGDYPRAEEAVKKCEDLNRKIRLPLIARKTAYYMAKYGSCFWEKTWSPEFDARLIPMQEAIEPAKQNEIGDIIEWRQNAWGGENAVWTEDEIIHFDWDVTSQSWPYGTSLLVGLENECEVLDDLETNAKDYMEKQAWPYEILQLGDENYRPTDDEISTVKSKWKNRRIGENIISTYPSDLKQGGTGGQPIQALHNLLNFVKDNIIDGMMVPPISKQWSSTEASAKEMMPWARANLIEPMQQIIGFIIEDQVYKPYLMDLGYSVKVCPKILWESPDIHKDEEAEYWATQVSSGIVPPEYAAEQQGFDLERIKQLRQEQLKQQAEFIQLQKVSPMAQKQEKEEEE